METISNFLAFIVLFIFGCVLTTLAGAFIGLFVGWFFSTPILGFFAAIGIEGFKMWEIGAALGFIGGFFRSSVTNYNFSQRKS